MIGISWSGFNSLQIAARRPPALKAIVTLCSTDDRYADDVHYDGRLRLARDMLQWAASMFTWNARPPDPAIVGERWREMWLERMRDAPPFIDAWLAHQRRDDYWKQGSVCEDYAAIEAAVYAIGGWADGYTNAIPRLLEGLPGPRKGLIGPWAHAWPQAGPARAGDRLSAGGVALVGPLAEGRATPGSWTSRCCGPGSRSRSPPRTCYRELPGRWVAEPAWPPPDAGRAAAAPYGAGRLARRPGPAPAVELHRPADRRPATPAPGARTARWPTGRATSGRWTA